MTRKNFSRSILALLGFVIFYALVMPHAARAANIWYVKTSGSDANSCSSAGDACATVNGALNKGGFITGDTVKIAGGTYTATGSEVVLLNQNATLDAGWDSTFSTQNEFSIFDGQDARRVLEVNSGVTASVTRVQIVNGFPGDSAQGGGIRNAGTLTVNTGIIKNNRTHGSSAAGIFNTGTLVMNETTVRDNDAQNYGYIVSGGGIGNNGTLTLNNSAVTDNVAAFGAGISQSGGTLILNNSTVSRNTSNGGINAAGIVSYGGTTQLNNVTITENYGNAGIGLAGGSITLRNTILAGNYPDGSGADCGGAIPQGAITSLGYNLIGSGCDFTRTTGDQTASDAKLSILIGTPGYHALLPDSPARNAGNPAGCAGSNGTLTTDQRGVARSGICDIGAYEYTTPGAAASIQVVSGASQRSPRNIAFWNPLQTIVLDAVGSPVQNANVTFTAPANGASGAFADTQTNSSSVNTNTGGVAQAASFQANDTTGSYVVNATVGGVGSPAVFDLSNIGWYVSASGNDANDCQSPATACRTISGALNHAGFEPYDTILVGAETIHGTGNEILRLDTSARLLGGWNAAFSAQDGMTTLDGQNARRGVFVSAFVTALLNQFDITNGYLACCDTQTGAGIYNAGNLTLEHSIVQHNESASYGAGGIFNISTLNVYDSEISHNTASNYSGSGGGIDNGGGLVRIARSMIQNNSASGGSGGGIFNNGGTIYLDTSAVRENAAAGAAGISNGGSAYINNSAIVHNTASSNGSGGGISGSAFLKITNSTISGNTAGHGGGILHSGGALVLESVTISGNHALVTGGGLSAGGTVTLYNTLLAANIAPQDADCSGMLTSGGYNLVGQVSSNCSFTPGAGDITNTNAFVEDAGDNGGPTETVRVRSASPAINHGDAGSCLPQDQRGVARPQGAGCDIGAFELDAAPAADLVLQQSDSPDPVAFGETVTYTLSAQNNGPQAATDVDLDAVPPLKSTFKTLVKPAGWNCTTPSVGTNGAIHCSIASFANGATASFLLELNVNASKKKRADLINYAALSAEEYDPGSDALTLNESTCAGVPVKPKLLLPANGSVETNSKTTFDWNDAKCATRYRLYVRKDSLTGIFVVTKEKLSSSTYTPKKALVAGTYYWQVHACNALGCQSSKWFRFTKK